jgi:acyl-CoA thioesterase FadM
MHVELDGRPVWSTELEVRVGDINYGRHLGHDALVTLVHEARARFFAAYGFSEWDVAGASTMVVELGVRYRAEAFWGDRLRIEIHVGRVRSRGCELRYGIVRAADGGRVAEATTSLVFVDPPSGRLRTVPDELADVLLGRADV